MDENIGEAGGEEQQRRSHDSAHWRGYSALKPLAASNRIQCGHLACAARRRGDDTMTRRRQGDDDEETTPLAETKELFSPLSLFLGQCLDKT